MDRENSAELLASADRHPAVPPKFYQPQPLKRPLEEAENAQEVKRSRGTVRRHLKYRRHGKPPYTYVGMIAVAIHTSSSKRLTLVGIRESLAAMFPFFQGEYLGWRDSVRHNLSSNKCFIRIQTGVKKNVKGCFWKVDLALVPPTAFLRASIKEPVLREQWAPTLTEQLGIPDVDLVAAQTNIKSEEPENSQQVTPEKVHKEHLTQKTAFSIDNILSKNTLPDLICEPPDKKFDHPYSFLGHQTSTSFLQGKFPQPASTYAAMLYQTVNFGQGSGAESFLRPDPQYSEDHPFSTMASDLRKCPDQAEGQASSRYHGNSRYPVAEHATQPAMYVDHRQTSEHDLDQYQTDALHHQTPSTMNYKQAPLATSYTQPSSMSYLPPSSTSYLPPPSTNYRHLPSYHPSPVDGQNKPSSFMGYCLPPPASNQPAYPSLNFNEGPSVSYNSYGTSYDAKQQSLSYNTPSISGHQTSSSYYDEYPSMTYHHWSHEYPVLPSPAKSNDSSCMPRPLYIPPPNSDSRDTPPMGPPKSSAPPPIPSVNWATYLSNTSSNNTSSPLSLKTAFDDLSFSDASSEVSVRPNIPFYVFVDDSQSLPGSVVHDSVTSELENPAFSPSNTDVINNFEQLFPLRNLHSQ
ncbi:uncharacterized protein [Haliotis asinina]|uniref:uncharacterized protein n=1 Tax=Haliotis asinina TaxID=109174 RepID=UPI003531FEB7